MGGGGGGDFAEKVEELKKKISAIMAVLYQMYIPYSVPYS